MLKSHNYFRLVVRLCSCKYCSMIHKPTLKGVKFGDHSWKKLIESTTSDAKLTISRLSLFWYIGHERCALISIEFFAWDHVFCFKLYLVTVFNNILLKGRLNSWSLSSIRLLCLFIFIIKVLLIESSMLEIANNHSFVHIGDVTFITDVWSR